MCSVTHRAKPYQLSLLIIKSLDDIIGTQQSACEATLQYQFQNLHFSLIYALFAESSINTFKEKCIHIILSYELKFLLRVSFKGAFKSKVHVPPETIG